VVKAVDEAAQAETVRNFLTLFRRLRRYSRQVHGEGLSGRKVAALRYLLDAGPLTIGQLRDYLFISDSSTSELVARLVERGFVTRSRSQTDNRVVLVTLTPAGRKVASQIPLGGIPLLRERLKTLPAERLALVNEATSELLQLLEDGRDA
jgi:DNA-binding MarR family transcriptional regulator